MMKPEPDELALAIRAGKGDPEALADLIERLRVGLFALAYAELRHYDDAQDAVAAALVQICRYATEVRDPASMRAWMATIVRNETHRMRRGRAATHASNVSLDTARTLSVEDPSPHLRLDIERALRQLPQDQAQALSLFYLQGWAIAEIARHLTRPAGTIKYWLHQGRQRLATEMKGYHTMEQNGKACIVAPQLTAIQLQSVTTALTAAGFADVQNVAGVRSLDDLYHTDTPPSVFMNTPGGSIGISNEGESTRVVYESADRQLRIDSLLSDQDFVRLIAPLADCDFLILSERIAGRSAFEFLPLLHALAPAKLICLLLDPPVSDATYLSCFVSGVTKLHTLRAQYSDLELRDNLQAPFTDVYTHLKLKETSD